jgi:hypothetical protein
MTVVWPKLDLAAVGALEKTGIAGLAARCRIEAGLVELDAAVFVNSRDDRLRMSRDRNRREKGHNGHGSHYAGS